MIAHPPQKQPNCEIEIARRQRTKEGFGLRTKEACPFLTWDDILQRFPFFRNLKLRARRLWENFAIKDGNRRYGSYQIVKAGGGDKQTPRNETAISLLRKRSFREEPKLFWWVSNWENLFFPMRQGGNEPCSGTEAGAEDGNGKSKREGKGKHCNFCFFYLQEKRRKLPLNASPPLKWLLPLFSMLLSAPLSHLGEDFPPLPRGAGIKREGFFPLDRIGNSGHAKRGRSSFRTLSPLVPPSSPFFVKLTAASPCPPFPLAQPVPKNRIDRQGKGGRGERQLRDSPPFFRRDPISGHGRTTTTYFFIHQTPRFLKFWDEKLLKAEAVNLSFGQIGGMKGGGRGASCFTSSSFSGCGAQKVGGGGKRNFLFGPPPPPPLSLSSDIIWQSEGGKKRGGWIWWNGEKKRIRGRGNWTTKAMEKRKSIRRDKRKIKQTEK